jgi:hypothetical protein
MVVLPPGSSYQDASGRHSTNQIFKNLRKKNYMHYLHEFFTSQYLQALISVDANRAYHLMIKQRFAISKQMFN